MEREIQVYDKLAPHYRQVQYSPWDTIVNVINSLPPGSLLLDIGCGSGRFMDLSKHVVNIGLDPATEQCKLCSEKGHANVLRANGLQLPFRDSSFDHVICIHVIHHFPTTELRSQLLKEICRVLRVSGTATVTAWSTKEKCERDVLVPWRDPRGLDRVADLERFYHYFELGEFSNLCQLVDGLICGEEILREDGRLEAQLTRVA